eukprot:12400922-Karenia_brevis.AAC.1
MILQLSQASMLQGCQQALDEWGTPSFWSVLLGTFRPSTGINRDQPVLTAINRSGTQLLTAINRYLL